MLEGGYPTLPRKPTAHQLLFRNLQNWEGNGMTTNIWPSSLHKLASWEPTCFQFTFVAAFTSSPDSGMTKATD